MRLSTALVELDAALPRAGGRSFVRAQDESHLGAAPWKQRMAQGLRFEGDRVIEVQDFLDVDRALEAAGLSE
jgi:hypothetical protein